MSFGSDDEFSVAACASPTRLSWWISRASECLFDARQVDTMKLWSVRSVDVEQISCVSVVVSLVHVELMEFSRERAMAGAVGTGPFWWW